MRIEGLSFGYHEESVIFNDLNFCSDNPIIIFCGRSGCGKTTLLKLIAGVLKPILIKEFDVPNECRMILQEDALFPWLLVKDNIALVKDSKQGKYEQFLIPIQRLLDKYVFELSYGQRRLVELCRSLIDAPSLLCLDEPFNFLDLSLRKKVASLIKSIVCEGTRVIMTTHHQEDIEFFDAKVFHFPEEFPIFSLNIDS